MRTSTSSEVGFASRCKANRKIGIGFKLAVISAAVTLCGSANASDYQWNGSVSEAWSNSANWTPNGVPGAGDSVTFDGNAANAATDLEEERTVDKISFTGPDFRIYGAPITVTTGEIEVLEDGRTYTITCQTRFPGNADWDTAGSTVLINRRIVPDEFFATIEKYGSGTLSLSRNNNSVQGLVDVREGTLELLDIRAIEFADLNLEPNTVLKADTTILGGLAGSGQLDISTRLDVRETSNSDVVFSGDLAGDFILDFQIGRTLILDGDKTQHTGAIELSSGDVFLTGDVGVNSTATLEIRNGTLYNEGNLPPLDASFNGSLAPGASSGDVGTITTENLRIDGVFDGQPGTLVIEIGSAEAGITHDQILVSGPIELGLARIEVTYLNGYVADPNDSFVVLDGDSITGRFTEFSYPDSQPWYVEYNEAAGTATLRFCDGGPDCDGNGLGDQCEFDSDGDSVIDACDICPGEDDFGPDVDGDGIPDPCDTCIGIDVTGDSDGDGVCDSNDNCPGADDAGTDTDGDGIPDACDLCDLQADGDIDGDGDIDNSDTNGVEACVSGPDQIADAGCDCFDLNYDRAVTMADYAMLQNRFSGDIIIEGPGEISLSNMMINASDKGFAMRGEFPDDFAGWSVALVGDFNADGLGELLIGAPSYGTGTQRQIGKAYVVYGKEDFSSVNLSDISAGIGGFAVVGQWGDYGHPYQELEVGAGVGTPDDAFPSDGGPQGGGFGFRVAGTGDFNGDNIADMLITAPYAPATDIWGGRAYVLFGGYMDSSNSPYAVQFQWETGRGLVMVGENGICPSCPSTPSLRNGDLMGLSADGVRDFNGDGLADVLLGAPYNGDGDEGSGYVVYGTSDATPLDLTTLASSNSGLIMRAENTFGNPATGARVNGLGDLNGDGLSEVVLLPDQPWTQSFVVPGRSESGTQALINNVNTDGVTRIVPTNAFSCGSGGCSGRFPGQSVAGGKGDFNGDGQLDYVITTYNLTLDEQEIFILFDEPNNPVNIANLFGEPDAPFNMPVGGVRIYSRALRLANFETDLDLSGDLNGDGFDDLVFGAIGHNRTDRTIVVFGGPGNRSIDLDRLTYGDEGLLITDRTDNPQPGFAVDAGGDFNGDGLNDLALGAPYDDRMADDAGATYVVYGADFNGSIDYLGDPDTSAIFGTSAAENIVAGRGNNNIYTNGGADTVYAGAGLDVIYISDTTFHRIRGGAGFDDLVSNGGLTLDLSSWGNRVQEIEQISLDANGADVVNVQVMDVLNMSQISNRLIIKGSADDKVVSLGEAWVFQGPDPFVVGQRFTSGRAQLIIDNDMDIQMSPVITTNQLSVDENTLLDTIVDVIGVYDPDQDGIDSMTITGGSGAGFFAVDTNTYELSVSGNLDHETSSSYTLEIEVVDGEGDATTKTITVNINDLNEGPTWIGQNVVSSIEEHAPIGTLVGTFLAVDVDSGDVLTYTVDVTDPNLTSPAPAGAFAFDPIGILTVADSSRLDYEAASMVDFYVYATDSQGVSTPGLLISLLLTNSSGQIIPLEGTFETTNASMWDTDGTVGASPLQFQKFIDNRNSPPITRTLLGYDFTAQLDGQINFESTIAIDSGSVDARVPFKTSFSIPDEIVLGQPINVGLFIEDPNEAPSMSGTTPAADLDIMVDMIDFEVLTAVSNFGPYTSTTLGDSYVTSSTPTPWAASQISATQLLASSLYTRLLAADDVDWDSFVENAVQALGLPSNEGTLNTVIDDSLILIMYYRLWGLEMSGSIEVDQELGLTINGYVPTLILEDGTQITFTADVFDTITLPVGSDVDDDGYVDFELHIDIDQTFSNFSDFYGVVTPRYLLGQLEVTAQLYDCETCQEEEISIGPLFDASIDVNIGLDQAGVPTQWPKTEVGTFPLGGFNTLVITGTFDLDG